MENEVCYKYTGGEVLVIRPSGWVWGSGETSGVHRTVALDFSSDLQTDIDLGCMTMGSGSIYKYKVDDSDTPLALINQQAIDINTVSQWRLNNSLLDSTTNGHDLINTGNVPFSSGNKYEGTHSAGPFSNLKYLTNTSIHATMSGNNTWTVEGVFNFSEVSTIQTPLLIGNATSDHVTVLYHNSAVKLAIDDVVKVTSNLTIATGLDYYFKIKANASNNVDFYFNEATSGTTLVGNVNTAGAGTYPIGDKFRIGANTWIPQTYEFTGYMDYVTVSDIARPARVGDPK